MRPGQGGDVLKSLWAEATHNTLRTADIDTVLCDSHAVGARRLQILTALTLRKQFKPVTFSYKTAIPSYGTFGINFCSNYSTYFVFVQNIENK